MVFPLLSSLSCLYKNVFCKCRPNQFRPCKVCSITPTEVLGGFVSQLWGKMYEVHEQDRVCWVQEILNQALVHVCAWKGRYSSLTTREFYSKVSLFLRKVNAHFSRVVACSLASPVIWMRATSLHRWMLPVGTTQKLSSHGLSSACAVFLLEHFIVKGGGCKKAFPKPSFLLGW